MSQKVMLYALSTCSHCKRTKQMLNDNGVNFDFVDVDLTQGEQREALIDEVRRYNPQLTFPTLVVGDKVVVGFRENEIKELLGL